MLPRKISIPEGLEWITSSSSFTGGYLNPVLTLSHLMSPAIFPPQTCRNKELRHSLPQHSPAAPPRPNWDQGTGAGRFPFCLMLKKSDFLSKSVPSTSSNSIGHSGVQFPAFHIIPNNSNGINFNSVKPQIFSCSAPFLCSCSWILVFFHRLLVAKVIFFRQKQRFHLSAQFQEWDFQQKQRSEPFPCPQTRPSYQPDLTQGCKLLYSTPGSAV